MPANPDGVTIRIVQVDALGNEPWDEPMDELTEGIQAAAFFAVETGKDDKLAAIWRDGVNLRFRDEAKPGTSGGGFTLSDLLASGGSHDTIDDLVHNLAENFHVELIKNANGKITDVRVWTDDTKTTKIREMNLTFDSLVVNRLNQAVEIQYDAAGVEIQRMTYDLNYDPNKPRKLLSIDGTES